ncbi:hypothetical protein ILUMI_05180 [Ignelater luminosus]|uniref:Uncharacterized protein n=1 Tax=Ignelater luminosus TaxID=2038154 RepID=A0A8K0GDT8_IGNLU|nr:hypothetical protein ILUMI_05180 [Ignelater luminosus]
MSRKYPEQALKPVWTCGMQLCGCAKRNDLNRQMEKWLNMLKINVLALKDFGEEYDEEIPLDDQSLDSDSSYDPDDKEDNTSTDEDSYGNENVENCSQTPTLGLEFSSTMSNNQVIQSNENTEKNFNSKKRRRLEGASYMGYQRTKERKRVPVAQYFTRMYEVFLEWCRKNKKPAATRQVFTKLLSKEKIAIYTPRKDQCNTCCGYKVGTVGFEEYQKYLKRKDEARAAKNAAKKTASSAKLDLTMDLQSVLLCPKTLASAINKVLSSASSNIAVEKFIVLNQLHLEKGRTMMEADNVHFTLEQYFKPTINSPMDYVARMRVARPKQPYKIEVLNYDFFFKYDDVPTNLPSLYFLHPHAHRYKSSCRIGSESCMI